MTRNRSFETHSGWGAAVALAAAVAGAPAWVAFLIGFAAGVLVEAVQWAFPKTGSATVDDVIYTGIGALAGAGWILLF
jgi:glycopeptide antibiotics resistance protein